MDNKLLKDLRKYIDYYCYHEETQSLTYRDGKDCLVAIETIHKVNNNYKKYFANIPLESFYLSLEYIRRHQRNEQAFDGRHLFNNINLKDLVKNLDKNDKDYEKTQRNVANAILVIMNPSFELSNKLLEQFYSSVIIGDIYVQYIENIEKYLSLDEMCKSNGRVYTEKEIDAYTKCKKFYKKFEKSLLSDVTYKSQIEMEADFVQKIKQYVPLESLKNSLSSVINNLKDASYYEESDFVLFNQIMIRQCMLFRKQLNWYMILQCKGLLSRLRGKVIKNKMKLYYEALLILDVEDKDLKPYIDMLFELFFTLE